MGFRGETVSAHPANEAHRPAVSLRPYKYQDLQNVASLLRSDLQGSSFDHLPKKVRKGLEQANREPDVQSAINKENSEAIVVETAEKKLAGFALIRTNGQTGGSLQMDIARFSPAFNISDMTVTHQLIHYIDQLARTRGADEIHGLALGVLRPLFEAHNWHTETDTKELKKRSTDLVVAKINTKVKQHEPPYYDEPDFVICASGQQRRIAYGKRFINPAKTYYDSMAVDESREKNPVVAARSKVDNARKQLGEISGSVVVFSGDVLNRFVFFELNRQKNHATYKANVVTRGKPESLEDFRRDMEQFTRTADMTEAPVQVIVTAATVVYDSRHPQEYDAVTVDAGYSIKPEAVAEWSTVRGSKRYNELLHDVLKKDVTEVAGGLSYAVAEQEGAVSAWDNVPTSMSDLFPGLQSRIAHHALVSLDADILHRHLGYASSD